ncbi:MFS transporter [Alicyclobacillus sp. TC]|uniref:MFS family permease n=1 Tax=Alicyclobacillus tolerans TaxID=90970 RepID=A0ABT9LWD1_9BACL|nr:MULTISPECIES: MFS transporter [Alicyclobacillus]MDP9728583.1 MFS family permease [Alicyclobacillus tengchongensis]QRF22578.1 MFS transporter [Alicyclobacillus sp. TC]
MHLLLRNRLFLILFSGQFVSSVGSNLFSLALPWYVLLMTKSTTDLALSGIMGMIPSFFTLFSGVLVDRWSKRWTMLLSDFIRAILCLAMTVSVIIHFQLWLILLLQLLLGIAGSVFSPASSAFVPRIVSDEEIPLATGLLQSMNSTSQIIGTMAGGVLIALIGAPMLFLLNGLSFFVSSLSLLFLKAKNDTPLSKTNASNLPGLKNFWREWIEGIQLIWKFKVMKVIIATAIVANFALTPFFILLTAWVKGPLHGTALVLAIIETSSSLGTILGSLLSAELGRRFSTRWQFGNSLFIMGLMVVLISLVHHATWTSVLAFIMGISMGNVNSYLFAILMRSIPKNLQGRIFGSLSAIVSIAAPLGLVIVTLLLSHVPLFILLIGIGALTIISSIFYTFPNMKDISLSALEQMALSRNDFPHLQKDSLSVDLPEM